MALRHLDWQELGSELMFLCERYWQYYFVREKTYWTYWAWDNKQKQLEIVEFCVRDNDELYDTFRDNYDYKWEWKYAVAHNDYEGSLEEYENEVDDNWWDYIDQVISPCNYDEVMKWVNEYIDSGYWDYNVENYGSSKIEMKEDWTYNDDVLMNWDNISEEDRDDGTKFLIDAYFWKGDFKWFNA